MDKPIGPRTAAQALVDQLIVNGVRHVFCVPGESYLAVLDALRDCGVTITVCRNEAGAAMMAEAMGKATGRPGVCFVTRGPGATNASPGVHIARHDSTPMLLFIGQIERAFRDRDAFQEMDYRAFFGSIAKWATEIDDAHRVPEIVSRAFHLAMEGRPGPVVVSLPKDMLTEPFDRRCRAASEPIETFPGAAAMASIRRSPGGRAPADRNFGRHALERRRRFSPCGASPNGSNCRSRQATGAALCSTLCILVTPAISGSGRTPS